MPRGQPKKFKNGDDLIDLFEEFCDEVKMNPESIYIPSETDFCLWLRREKNFECDRRTIYNSLKKYFPAVKKDFEDIRANALVNGAMRGRYQPTMTIFALKNWCGWTDKQEEKTDTSVEVKMDKQTKEYSE